MKVTLGHPNLVTDDKGNKGTWTIVNDEGIEIHINGNRYFHYLKWTPKEGVETKTNLGIYSKDGNLLSTKQTTSHCHASHPNLGTFHTEDNTKWGCYQAVKVGAVTEEDDYSNNEQVSESEHEDVSEDDATLDDVFDEEYQYDDASSDDVEDIEDEESGEVQFQNSAKLVDLINNSQTSWKATTYPQWELYTVSELRRMAGSEIKDAATYGQQAKLMKQEQENQSEEIEDSDDDQLPEQWDWSNVNGKNYLGKVKAQHNCGGCYTFGSMSALEARVRIRSNLKHQPTLSVQHALSCNPYAQGCNGGFSYLVGKFGKDYHMVDEACMKYKAETGKCSKACSNPKTMLKIKDYKFVGGFFGGSREKNMMREIYKNGPITAGFKVHNDLMNYKSGVYSHLDFNNLLGVSDEDVDVRAWEPTSHTIAIVGYGVENGQKYWKVQNSWGTDFGENGFFKIKRGTDECHIESAAVAIEPDMENSKFN
eukprot:TRINITY_DN1164_c0_g1_i2.p1 TRINITY_DN1164_c0_g1~~TRINITY_DN1164_c0_g1_i2.p1  ORF type:complete len:480 (-),score=161.67 TRINITY_DN1164_c0_g1_i2:47-1486(-)